jgi:hypothetical protein
MGRHSEGIFLFSTNCAAPRDRTLGRSSPAGGLFHCSVNPFANIYKNHDKFGTQLLLNGYNLKTLLDCTGLRI